MTVFYAKRNNLGFIIDPGGDVPIEVAPGVYKNKTLQEIKAKWDNHEFDSEKFFKSDKVRLTQRGWTLEKIDENVFLTTSNGNEFICTESELSSKERIKLFALYFYGLQMSIDQYIKN